MYTDSCIEVLVGTVNEVVLTPKFAGNNVYPLLGKYFVRAALAKKLFTTQLQLGDISL